MKIEKSLSHKNSKYELCPSKNIPSKNADIFLELFWSFFPTEKKSGLCLNFCSLKEFVIFLCSINGKNCQEKNSVKITNQDLLIF